MVCPQQNFHGNDCTLDRPGHFKRRKAALACTRIVGCHTYDVLGANLHNSYGLARKIAATITDNGSNFIKAFAVFHQTSESISTEEASSNVTMEEDPDDLCDNIYTDEATFENMDQVLTADIDDELTQVQYDLPAHERCAAHTLNLVASADIEKHLSTSSSSRTIYRSTLAKCSAIWNKVNQSTIISDCVQEIAKKNFPVPNKTRWNAQYDAIVRITENTMSELNGLCTRLGVPKEKLLS